MASSGGSEGFRTFAGGCNPPWGWVYVATCHIYPGDVKIGATTLKVKKRLKTFSYRWNLPEMELVFAMEVANPFMIEDLAATDLRPHRISGRTKGKSNEWYRFGDDLIQAAWPLIGAAVRSEAQIKTFMFPAKHQERVDRMYSSIRNAYTMYAAILNADH